MNDVDKLVAVEEIKKLMFKRIRSMDMKNWEEYDTCHTDDATSESYGAFQFGNEPPSSVARGKSEILSMVKKIVDGNIKLTSVHHPAAPEIEILSDTVAKAIWILEDQFWWTNNGVEESFHGYGHYYETYQKVDGRWLIKSRKVTRLRVEETPGFHQCFKQ